MRRAVLLSFALAPLSCPPALAAEEGKVIPYAEMAEILRKIDAAKTYDRLLFVTRVREQNDAVPPESLVFSIESKTKPQTIKAGPEGVIALPYAEEYVQENAPIRVNVPAGTSVEFMLAIEGKLPDAQHFSWGDVQKIGAQFDAFIAQEAGMMSFLAPSVEGVKLHCGPSCSARIGDGAPIPADAAGVVTLSLDDGPSDPGLAVTVSQPVTRTEISAE
ncbi:MAG: DUF2987 domain-containing protein [Alphaproteobacteria bacterium]|nr:DUF2987 domain-containing protein [Alphaproteobacteria bacterium]